MSGSAMLNVASSFTAEPMATVLDYWIGEQRLGVTIAFAPFDQVLRTLVDPASLFFQGGDGLNIAAVRWEDLGRRGHDLGALDVIDGACRELIAAAKAAAERSRRPILVASCPPSPAALATAGFTELARRLDVDVAAECEGTAGLYFLGTEEITTRYPFDEGHDPYGDREGRIPYTPLGFAALSTMIARKLDAIHRKSPFKVIVLDCDHTMWSGVVGEDGVDGVVVDEGRRVLQRFVAEQKSTYGMLLCMASKNNEADVFELFTKRQDMVLKREDFVAWRINWDRKSDSLVSLASELQLGLDSFIFIDDDPVQCAEIRAVCPKVCVIEIPREASEAATLLLETWAFDHAKVTDEDRRRTAFYEDNRERESTKSIYGSVDEYLASLRLEVNISGASAEQLSRMAQLTQRTNQFNCGNIKRTEVELKHLQEAGVQLLVVDVKDRFGDYGLVGAVAFDTKEASLEVDTFLLSCRALGRKVEHAIVDRLREEARARGLARVNIVFRPTPKNRPAADFLAAANAAWTTASSDETVVYGFPSSESGAA